ncbi:MAG: hypothetical protein WEC75_01680 [Dehalococcoidia bacterium]
MAVRRSTNQSARTPKKAVSEEERAKRAKARAVVARVRANKEFVAGVRESLEARRRGEKPISLDELKRLIGDA